MPNSTFSLWKTWNKTNEKLTKCLPTRNVVGEIGELLATKYLKGKKETNSKSYDIIGKDGLKYQVKSRQLEKLKSTSLNVVRHWDFDKLFVIIFDTKGFVLKGMIMDAKTAKKHSKKNILQNGHLITTNMNFLNEETATDITAALNEILK